MLACRGGGYGLVAWGSAPVVCGEDVGLEVVSASSLEGVFEVIEVVCDTGGAGRDEWRR